MFDVGCWMLDVFPKFRGLALPLLCLATTSSFAASSETFEEFHATADVNGDGRPDLVIVDKPSGIYRVAYGQASGTNLWVDGRPSGIENVTGFSVGRVLNTGRDALAFTAPEANRVNVFDAFSLAQAGQPVNVFLSSLGPNRVVALDIGGAGNTAHHDLYIASLANNAPNPARLTLTRSTGNAFSQLQDLGLSAYVLNADAVKLKTNAANPVLAGAILQASGGTRSFVTHTLVSGLPVSVAMINNLPATDRFLFANFNGTALNQFLFYRAGAPNLVLAPVQEPVPNSFSFGALVTFNLGSPVRQVIALPGTNDIRLLAIFGAGETARIYSFDGATAPQLLETFTAEGDDKFTGAIASGNGNFTLLNGKDGYSTKYQDWKRSSNGYVKGDSGELPAINPLTTSANVFLFANKPFVHPTPRLVASLNAADWSSSFQTTNPAGQINVTAERFVSSTQGLKNPAPRNLGALPAGAAFGLPNQIMESFSLLSFSPAIGNEVVEVNIAPAPGHYSLGVSVSLSTPVNAQIRYRFGANDNWKLYSAALPLYKDTTLQYYATANGLNSTIRSATYTFSKPPEQLDSDGDGVPDFVEIALGGDANALNSKDSDGDGYSDLAEILAGADGDPYQASIVPTNAPRANELSAFDWRITPRAFAGVIPEMLRSEVGTVVSAFHLHGGLLDSRATEAAGNASHAYFSNLFAHVTERLYVGATEPHFDVWTNGTSFPADADTRVGRELLCLLPVPELAAALQINYTYGGGTLQQEAAAWIAAAKAAQAAVQHPVLDSVPSYEDTLTALLVERKISTLLLSRNLLAPTNKITLFPFRPQDAGRINPAHADLLSLETNLVLNTGAPNPAFPGHKLVDLYRTISNAATTTPTANIERLNHLAAYIYLTSALSNNVAPGQYPSPVDTLRLFLEEGTLHSNYLAVINWTAPELASATTGVSEILNGPAPRPTTLLTLRVRPTSFTGGCVILETPGGFPRSLVLPDGTAFKFPVAFELVPDSLVEVHAYTDLPPTCGVPTLEVISLNVFAFPDASSGDANGNLLADAWEWLYGLTDPFGDDDNDGASNFKEFLDGTDPKNAISVGGPDDATPPVVKIEPAPGAQLKFSWNWPAPYADKIQFHLVSASDMSQPFLLENAQVQNLGNGQFQIIAPNSGGPAKFYRLLMKLK
jgi:hypothetical protein